MTRKAWIIWGIAVFIIPFQLYYDYALNMFYDFGALSGDAGLFAHLVWHGDWSLTTPVYYGSKPFFCQHFTPLLLLISQLSYFIPSHMAEYYITFVSAIYASFGLALFYAFSCCLSARNHWHMAALAALAIAFSFNGVVMSGIDYFHFEYAIPLGIFLFLLSFVRGQRRLSIFIFIITLSIREDAGFHLTAVLGLLALIRFIEKRSFAAIKQEVFFTVAAFAYSLFGCWSTYHLSSSYGQGTQFSVIYAGYPPYAHLSWELLAGRAQEIFPTHIYIWLPILLGIGYAVFKRDPYMAVGSIAYIPWLVLNVTGFYETSGRLNAYYAFPFTLSLAWPVIAAMYRYGLAIPKVALRETMIMQVLFLAIGLVTFNIGAGSFEFGPYYGGRWVAYRLQEGTANRKMIRDFAAKFDAGAGDFGKVMGDETIFSVIHGDYQGKPMVSLLDLGKQDLPPVDTIMYFDPPQRPRSDEIISQAQKNNLSHRYCIAGTTFCMFTNRTLQRLAPYSSLLMESPLPPQAAK